MPHVIDSNCVACGACKDVCGPEAIIEDTPCYRIDPEKCKDCGNCVDECPNEAIHPEK